MRNRVECHSKCSFSLIMQHNTADSKIAMARCAVVSARLRIEV